MCPTALPLPLPSDADLIKCVFKLLRNSRKLYAMCEILGGKLLLQFAVNIIPESVVYGSTCHIVLADH